jgi:hypothetical protein
MMLHFHRVNGNVGGLARPFGIFGYLLKGPGSLLLSLLLCPQLWLLLQ